MYYVLDNKKRAFYGPHNLTFKCNSNFQQIIVGNVSVIVAVILSRRLQTITNVYVVILSCSDIVIALILPIKMSIMLDGTLEKQHLACAVTGSVSFICNGCSVFTLIMIAFNRYFLITQPKERYQRLFTKYNIALMNLFTLGVSDYSGNSLHVHWMGIFSIQWDLFNT